MPTLGELLGEPVYSTADINAALEAERQKRLPVRSSFLGGIVPQVSAQDAAMNRPEPVERASLFPLATYPDGSTRLALPGMIAEDIPKAFTAPARAYRGEIPDEDMIAEGLNFGGTMAMGGSVVPKGASTVARVAANATESAAPGVIVSEAGRETTAPWYRRMLGDKSLSIRGYRGSASNQQHWRRSDDPVFASSSPDTASTYAMNPWLQTQGRPSAPNVAPLDFRFSNPYVHDAKGRNYLDVGNGASTDDLALAAAEKGHDGLIIRNVVDNPTPDGSVAPQTTIAALRRGTVYSPATGDLLFENGANAAAPGVIVSEAARQPGVIDFPLRDRRMMPSSTRPDAFRYEHPVMEALQSGADKYAVTDAAQPLMDHLRDQYGYVVMQRGLSSDPATRGNALLNLSRAVRTMEDDPRFAERDFYRNRGRPVHFGSEDFIHGTDPTASPADVHIPSKATPDEIASYLLDNSLYANSRASSAPGVLAAEAADNRPWYRRMFGPRPDASNSMPDAPPGITIVDGYHGRTGHPITDSTQDLWGTTSQPLAREYAYDDRSFGGARRWRERPENPTVYDVQARFRNPLVIDAQGRRYNHLLDETLARREPEYFIPGARAAGHDGIIFKNIIDPPMNGDAPLADTFAALERGTVFDKKTGRILFENGTDAAVPGVIAAEAADKPRGIRAYHGSPHDFDRFSMDNFMNGEGAALGAYDGEPFLSWVTKDEDRAKHYRDIGGKTGHMYEVDVNVDPDRLVKSLRGIEDQSPFVQNALRSKLTQSQIEDWPAWSDILFNQKNRSAVARELGIQGKVSGTGADIGLVDPELIQILRKYMNPPTAAAPGVLMYEGAKDARQ